MDSIRRTYRRISARLLASLATVLSLLMPAGVTTAWAGPARSILKSDDTDLTLVYILGGVGVGVLIVAIVVRVIGSRAEGGQGPDRRPTGRHGR